MMQVSGVPEGGYPMHQDFVIRKWVLVGIAVALVASLAGLVVGLMS